MSSARILGVALLAGLTLNALGACGSSDDGEGVNDGPEGGTNPDGYVPPVRSKFGLDTRPSNTTCKAPARPPSTASVKWERVFNTATLNQPMMIAQIPGDSTRWFVAQREGAIRSFPVANPAALTDVATLGPIAGLNGEGGLLGMAFYPKFATTKRLYVTWTTSAGVNNFRSVVGYLTSNDNGATFGGYTEILGFDQTTATNHKGGGIAFGKDGFLYLSFGDGGGSDDTFVQGQKKDGFYSKILRIDVDNPDSGKPYGIPAANPFKNGGGEPATFAYGFRNPFRISVDRESSELWVGDVGQNKWEEIDAKVKNGGNYGWPCREGFHDYLNANTTKCPSGTTGIMDPIAELEHLPNPNTRSITGGVVYRGKAIPNFVGSYVYGDIVKQQMWTISFDPGTGAAKNEQLIDAPAGAWVDFAEDNEGEVYAVALNQGEIFKLLPATPAGPNDFPDRLSNTGCVDPGDAKKPAFGLVADGSPQIRTFE